MPESQYRGRQVGAKTQEVINYDRDEGLARQAPAHSHSRWVGGVGCSGSHCHCGLSDLVQRGDCPKYRFGLDRGIGPVLRGRRVPFQLWI